MGINNINKNKANNAPNKNNILKDKTLTQGELKRRQAEQKQQEAQLKKEQENVEKHKKELITNECLGVYKRTVIDSFVGVFNERYGDSFDYDTLIKSLDFTIKTTENSLFPDFTFTSNQVKFKGDIKREGKEFNENAMHDFISNDDIIMGNVKIRNYFDAHDEYTAYEEGNKNYSEIPELDGQFIPFTNSERYTEFNRINKLGGYEPVGQAGKDAEQLSSIAWNKVKANVISAATKKFSNTKK